MSGQGSLMIGLAAVFTALANLLLRGGVLAHGGLSLAPGRVLSDLLGLAMQPMFVSGVIFYALAALVWFSVLAVEDLSASYPVLVGLTFVLVAAGAVFFFSESFSQQKLLGMLIILGGIAVVARA